MAQPTCAKCDGHSFQLKTISPQDAVYKMSLVFCAACGTPAGAVESLNTEAVVIDAEGRLSRVMQEGISSLHDRLDRLERLLGAN